MDWRARLTPVVRWGSVIIGVMLAVSGTFAMVRFFSLIARPSFSQFVIYLYALIFGVLLALAELNFWPALSTYFGFLSTGGGRAWFLIFISLLCLSGGLSGNRAAVDHVLLSIAGIAGLIIAVIALVIRYQPDVNRGDTSGGGGGGGGGIGSIFNRNRGNDTGAPGGQNARRAASGPDVEI